MVKKSLMLSVAIIAISTLVCGQQFNRVELDNGLETIFVSQADSSLASVVLVCPLPADITAVDRANASVLSRLIWLGASSGGTTIEEHEYMMFARRFGGSIGSQLSADAMFIRYTMPVELFPQVLKYLAVQVANVDFGSDRLGGVLEEISNREKSVISSSVKRQLLRQLERHIFSELSYSLKAYGSDHSLASVDETSLNRFNGAFLKPSSWKLIINGKLADDDTLNMLNQTLGSIEEPAGSVDFENWRGAEPRLGQSLELPSSLAQRHAFLAFRLPDSEDLETEAVTLIAETIRRSPQLLALREDLSNDQFDAEVTVDYSMNRRAGMLYIYAKWIGDQTREGIKDRLMFITQSVTGNGASSEAYSAARKSLQLNYWKMFNTSESYANWVGWRETLNLKQDDYIDSLLSLTPGKLEEIAGKYLTSENSVSLFTVSR